MRCFYSKRLRCYVKIPDADAKAAADGNSDVLKERNHVRTPAILITVTTVCFSAACEMLQDAQLYEPPAKAAHVFCYVVLPSHFVWLSWASGLQ